MSLRLLSGSICLAGMLVGFGMSLRLSAAGPALADAPQEALAIEHVTILPMTVEGTALADMTVIVRDGRIVAVTPATGAEVTGDLRRIDGRGKWLMPGLTDMHVHVENARGMRLALNKPEVSASAIRNEDVFAPYIANGVVQVFVLQAMSETIGQRVEIEAGRVLGPHILAAAMIDGSPPIWPVGTTRVATTPEAGRQAVRDAAAEGYDAIKVYSRLTLETFSAIVEEAQRLKLPVVGHIPGRRGGRTEEFFQPGFGMVAHAEEFAQQTEKPSIAAIPRYVAMMKKNGAWLTATLSLDERLLEQTSHPETLRTRPDLRVLHPMWREMVVHRNPYVPHASPERIEFLRSIIEFNRELVRAFVAAGIPVVAGTDALVPGMVPGYAMHDELAALAGAGMSTRQVLEAATRLPCEWLGVAADRGTVEIGKRADLLLLDGDPLADIAHSKRISAVILGGRYLPSALLEQWMQALAAR
jgi:imidazolonepropionase-like amidohydrolase